MKRHWFAIEYHESGIDYGMVNYGRRGGNSTWTAAMPCVCVYLDGLVLDGSPRES